MSTPTRPSSSAIKHVIAGHEDLKGDILGLISAMDNLSIEDEDQQLEIDLIKTQLLTLDTRTLQTPQEVIDARGSFTSLTERLQGISEIKFETVLLKASTKREYLYDINGFITDEIVSGDIVTHIKYFYNTVKNIVREERYQDGVMTGHKDYIYDDEDQILSIDGVNADDVSLVYNKHWQDSTMSLLDSLELVPGRLDLIERAMLTGPYDGKKLSDLVLSFDQRMQMVEGVTNGEIIQLIDLPAITDRMNRLERLLTTGFYRDEFITDGIKIKYELTHPVSSYLEVYLEGLLMEKDSDYVTTSSNEIQFLVELLPDYKIVCKY